MKVVGRNFLENEDNQFNKLLLNGFLKVFDINYFSYDTLLMYLPLVLDGVFVVTETCIVDLTLLVSSRRFSGEDLSFKCSG